MKFTVERASETLQGNIKRPVPNAELIGKDSWGKNVWSIEIDSLEELIALKTKVAHSLILEFADDDVKDLDNDVKYNILIYDDYIE